ncbi:hypothetical protein ACFQ5D_18065 [Paenibacillus farraposensis]|uniref:Phage ABA sandwich domain-containing protein n=1 Tax=Paenibacillus farraposensis TaxID=2807095 RepID=A0ABW4DFC3_9BACL|nr:hypothetical protein [Paenibacillus farraposensis]MCC3381936.1 hypothetical protein [Paenibacillus farraposensis]
MNRDEVIAKWNSMQPRERDAWVAEEVMGLTVVREKRPYGKVWVRAADEPGAMNNLPVYSTGMGATWKVLERVRGNGYSFTLGEVSEKSGSFIRGEAKLGDNMCNFHIATKGIFTPAFRETMPEAICLAALIATQGEGIEE